MPDTPSLLDFTIWLERHADDTRAALERCTRQSRPRWPEPGYDIADEIVDPTDWSINPEAGVFHSSGGPRHK
jgi:hypothetical protein